MFVSPGRQQIELSLEFLKGSTFLGCLSEEALSALLRAGHTKRYAKGEAICSRGSSGDSVMLVLSGKLKITNTTLEGREIGLNFLSVGDLVGEVAVLDGLNRTADVTALEASEVFVLYRRDLLPLLREHPEAMLEIIKALCEKLRTATSIIEDSSQEMRARFAKGLVRLAQQHGVRKKGQVRIDLRLSQMELGNYLGLSRPNVSRQLTHFKESGTIDVDGAHIVILDLEALAGAADETSSSD